MTNEPPRSKDTGASGGSLVLASALLTLAAATWGGNYVVGRAIAGEVPPGALSVVRWAIGFLVLLPFGFRQLRRDWPILKRHWLSTLLLSLAGGAMFGTVQYAALRYTTAVNGGLIGAISPLLIAAAGAVIFGDRLPRRVLQGLALSIGGVLIVVLSSRPAGVAFTINPGDALILFNLAVWAVYTACLRLKAPVHWLTLTIAIAAISAVANVPVALVEAAFGETLRPTPATFWAIAYTSIFTSVVAYAAWNQGVAIVGGPRAGQFLNLVPLFSIAAAWLFLGEAPQPHHAIAAVLIVAGIWVASRR